MLQPKVIQKIGVELAIAWSNGEETYVPLETLRRPCALRWRAGCAWRVLRPEFATRRGVSIFSAGRLSAAMDGSRAGATDIAQGFTRSLPAATRSDRLDFAYGFNSSPERAFVITNFSWW
jgi:hypothetical protein